MTTPDQIADKVELPKLPTPEYADQCAYVVAWSADQMEAYAREHECNVRASFSADALLASTYIREWAEHIQLYDLESERSPLNFMVEAMRAKKNEMLALANRLVKSTD